MRRRDRRRWMYDQRSVPVERTRAASALPALQSSLDHDPGTQRSRPKGPHTMTYCQLSFLFFAAGGGECQSCVGRHASCIVTASTHFWSFERCALTFTVVVERRGDPGALDGTSDLCADILPRGRSRHKYLILIHGNTTPRASAHHREGTKGRAPAFSLRL